MKRILGSLLGFALGSAFVLLLAEAGFRIAGELPTPIQTDPIVAIRWRPGAPYRWTTEGFSQGRINSAGWRDREYTLAKPPGTTRILFLGDSFVQAAEVPLDSAFHKIFERRLQAHAAPGHRFEAVALGRGGFGTTDEWLVYRHWGAAYDPDVVVLVFVLNDWSDNFRRPGGEGMRPYLIPEGDSLRLDTSFLGSAEFHHMRKWQWVKGHSAFATWAANALQVMRARFHPTAVEAGLTGARGWYEVWNFDRSPAADSIPAMTLTARILGRLAHDVRADGHRFVLVVTGASQNEVPEFLAERANDPNFDPDKVMRFLGAVAERESIETVFLTPHFRRWFAAGGARAAFGSGRNWGHWNVVGQHLAADSLYDDLAPTLGGIEDPALRRAAPRMP